MTSELALTTIISYALKLNNFDFMNEKHGFRSKKILPNSTNCAKNLKKRIAQTAKTLNRYFKSQRYFSAVFHSIQKAGYRITAYTFCSILPCEICGSIKLV